MDEKHEQRMQVIHARETAYRQMGIDNSKEAHDAIDYLSTRVRLLEYLVKEWKELGEHGMGVICNSKPDPSLNGEHREGYWMAMQRYLDTYHELKKRDV